MTFPKENVIRPKRRSCRQLSFQSLVKNDNKHHKTVRRNNYFCNRQSGCKWKQLTQVKHKIVSYIMKNSKKSGVISIIILICVLIMVFLLNLDIVKSSPYSCLDLNGKGTCFAKDVPYRYYGTKTAYQIVANINEKFEFGGCEPKIFYLLSRHATRYPDKEDIEEMIERLPQLQERIINASLTNKGICEEDIKQLKKWNIDLKPEYDNKLSTTGEAEAIELAQRLKARISSIFAHNYSYEKFNFAFTSKERTRDTAEAFAKGLFGNETMKINFDRMENDKVLNFHKECKTLQKKCGKSCINIDELNKFAQGPVIKMLIRSISTRLGFDVSLEDIRIMYRACSFGYALQINDIWCSVFSTEELKVLEYEDDLDDYYKDAYGNKINFQQACPVAQYLVNLFKSNVNRSDTLASLHFSHAGAVKKAYALFGLFNDNKPPTAENICSQNQRKWRSSLIAPFNSNLAFIFLKCENQEKISAYLNEKPVILEGCHDYLCPIEDFYNIYDLISKRCDINSTCCNCCIH